MSHGKRAFDLAGASFGTLVLLPVLGAIAVAIRLDSPGPIFYRGLRLGKNGVPFHMFKFRSMVRDAEKLGPLATPENDPRVTHIGRWLRNYKLDELPQLFNVIRGEMSLVGPRPEALAYFEFYTPEQKSGVLAVKPGMTDLASLRYHDEGKLLTGTSDPFMAYVERIKDEKVRIQLDYVARMSVRRDLIIILQTIGMILRTRLARRRV